MIHPITLRLIRLLARRAARQVAANPHPVIPSPPTNW